MINIWSLFSGVTNIHSCRVKSALSYVVSLVYYSGLEKQAQFNWSPLPSYRAYRYYYK